MSLTLLELHFMSKEQTSSEYKEVWKIVLKIKVRAELV